MAEPTPLDALRAALADVDRAVEGCLALAWAAGLDPDDRQRAAQRAVDAYQRADQRADLLLSAIIADGGAPGLLDTTEAAVKRANERTGAVLALRSGLPVTPEALAEAKDAEENKRMPKDPALRTAEHARMVAEHAEGRAAARDLRVRREVLLPWAQRRVRRTEEAA
jgi:prolyl-tRNA synthetase